MAQTGTLLSGGLSRYSRSRQFSRRATYKKMGKSTPKKAVEQKKEAPAFTKKTIGGAKNGQSRNVATKKASRFYPAEDVPRLLPSNKKARPTKIRSSITPGSVLILLAGRFRGKRVVCLGTTESGLLIVTGPYKINGVPVRRVNQAYVLATSTKVDVAGVDAKKFNDAYFKKEKKAEGEEVRIDSSLLLLFPLLTISFTQKKINAQRVADQKTVDASLLKTIKSTPKLAAYLNATFTLTHGQFPHQLNF